MAIFFAYSTNGFYDDRVHVVMPEDRVEVTVEERGALQSAIASGKIVSPNAQGKPVAIDKTPSIEEIKAAKLTEINTACDAEINAIRATYPETEVLSWPKQETEARALLKDDAAVTPLIDSIASGRGLARFELAERIVAKADAFALVSGTAIGKRQRFEDQIGTASTITDLNAVAW